MDRGLAKVVARGAPPRHALRTRPRADSARPQRASSQGAWRGRGGVQKVVRSSLRPSKPTHAMPTYASHQDLLWGGAGGGGGAVRLARRFLLSQLAFLCAHRASHPPTHAVGPPCHDPGEWRLPKSANHRGGKGGDLALETHNLADDFWAGTKDETATSGCRNPDPTSPVSEPRSRNPAPTSGGKLLRSIFAMSLDTWIASVGLCL